MGLCATERGEEVWVITSTQSGLNIAGDGEPISLAEVMRWPLSWSLDATPLELAGIAECHRENRGG